MVEEPKKKGGFFLHFIPYVVAISSAIAAITPPHSDDKMIQTIKLLTDILALNVGHSTPIHAQDYECQITSSSSENQSP